MFRIDSKGRGWATSLGRADEELSKYIVVSTLSEHYVIDVDGKTKLLAGGCRPEHPENHKCRTYKHGKV